MPDIYRYSDYRRYLKDYFTEQKASNSVFSHQYFARKASIKSSGFVLHVIKGERNLTRKVLHNIARAIRLDSERTSYFEDLVAFNQADLQSDREFYLKRIMEKRSKIKIEPIEDRQYELYSEWYHPVIREMVRLTGGKADHPGYAKKLSPPVTAKQVKESLKLQKNIGVLTVDDDGTYRQTEPYISGGGVVSNTILINYQKTMLDHAQNAWDRFPGTGEISMHSVTLPIPEDCIAEIRDEIRKFKERMFEIAASGTQKNVRVYHANVNLFPVTSAVEEKKQ